MRYNLRSLMIATLFAPPLLAGVYFVASLVWTTAGEAQPQIMEFIYLYYQEGIIVCIAIPIWIPIVFAVYLLVYRRFSLSALLAFITIEALAIGAAWCGATLLWVLRANADC